MLTRRPIPHNSSGEFVTTILQLKNVGMTDCGHGLRLAAMAAVLALAVAGAPGPLDISGDYNTVQRQTCRCWGQERGRPCYCASPGCEYVEQVSATPPDNGGVFQLTIHAVDNSCYSGQQGPFNLFVDRCGAVLTGATWGKPHAGGPFNPQAQILRSAI